jgi:hypothetical protein
MLEDTADEENGFHFANTVLVSSTVSPAAAPSRARNAKAVAPVLQPSSQQSGS